MYNTAWNKLTDRNEIMYEEWRNGKTYKDLAEMYAISPERTRQIVLKIQKEKTDAEKYEKKYPSIYPIYLISHSLFKLCVEWKIFTAEDLEKKESQLMLTRTVGKRKIEILRAHFMLDQ